MRSTTLFLVAIIAVASASTLRRTLSASKKMEVLAEVTYLFFIERNGKLEEE